MSAKDTHPGIPHRRAGGARSVTRPGWGCSLICTTDIWSEGGEISHFLFMAPAGAVSHCGVSVVPQPIEQVSDNGSMLCVHHIISSTAAPSPRSACTHTWSTYRGLVAIILVKQNMPGAEFKERKFNVRLPLERKKARKGCFLFVLMRLAEAQMSDGGGFRRMKENRKATKKNQNPLTSSLYPPLLICPSRSGRKAVKILTRPCEIRHGGGAR